jgi:hydrogenase expression/formation protein HypC
VCLAVPGRVEALAESGGLRFAHVDFGGVAKRICLETLPQARVGDWVLVHAGFALQVLDAGAAREVARLLEQVHEGAPGSGA